MRSSDFFTALISARKEYQLQVSQAKTILEIIHVSFFARMKPSLQRLGQCTQELQIAQMLYASASASEAAGYQALVQRAKTQFENVQGYLRAHHASYRTCKRAQDLNIERWEVEIGKINFQLSMFML